MSDLSPTLNLVVTADAKGLREIGEALALLKKAVSDVSGSTSEVSAAALAHSRDLEKTALDHSNRMSEISARAAVNTLKNKVAEYDTSLGYTKAHVANLLREAENSTLFLVEAERKGMQERAAAQASGRLLMLTEEYTLGKARHEAQESGRLLMLTEERKLAQDRAAAQEAGRILMLTEERKTAQERAAAQEAGRILMLTEERKLAQERVAAQEVGRILMLTEERKTAQERAAAQEAGRILMLTEERKAEQEHRAILVKRAEMDVAYGQMELKRQIALRREIAAVQANPILASTNYAQTKFAPAALADVRPIRDMEAALLGMQKNAAGAAGTFGTLNGAMREGHSLARGLLGPLNAMWLTWGSLLPLLAGAALSSSIVGAIKAGSDFEVVLSRIQGVSGETKERVKEAGEAFKDLAKNSIFGSSDVATGAQILVQAGLSLNDAIKSLPTVMQLAAVGELNMSNAAEIATGTMNAFGLSIAEIPGVANVLSKAADMSQTNIGEMGEAMKQSSTIAQQYQVSLIDMSAGIASLAQVNIRGSAAGTAYRNMLNNLATPSEKGAKALRELGVSAFDADGQIKNMPQNFKDLSAAINNLSTDAEKATVIADIFTERGAKGAVNYMRALDDNTIDTYTGKLRTVAETQDYLNAKQEALNNTVGVQAKEAFNSLGVAMINAFDSSSTGLLELTKRLKEFVQSPAFFEGLKTLVGGFVSLAKAIADNVEFLGVLAGAFVLLGPAKWAIALATTATSAYSVAGAMQAITVGVVGLQAALLPLAVAFLAAGALWWAFRDSAVKALDEVDARTRESVSLVEQATKVSYQATQSDKERAGKNLEEAALSLAFERANLQRILKNDRSTFDNLGSAGRSAETSNEVLRAANEVTKATKDYDTAKEANQIVTDKLFAQDKERADAAKKLAEGVKPASTAATNLKTDIVDTKAQAMRARENAAANAAAQEEYSNDIRNAKQLQSSREATAKQYLDAKRITADEYQRISDVAFEEYADKAMAAETTLSKRLKATEKEGWGEIDEIRLQTKRKKLADDRKFAEQEIKDAQALVKRKAEIEDEASIIRSAARLEQLNKQAAVNRENAQRTFDNRFDSSSETAGAKASLAAEKPYQAEIAAVQRILEIREQTANVRPGDETDNPQILALREQIALLEEAKTKTGELAASQAENNKLVAESWRSGASQAVKEYSDRAQNAAQITHNVITTSFSNMENALTAFVKTGKFDFKSFAASLIGDMIRIQAQAQLTSLFSTGLKMLSGAFSGGADLSPSSMSTGMLGAYAKGGAFDSGKVTAFASGGAFTNSVISSPTTFPMGLMGEAGPEAVMPLARDSSGRLGVSVSGSGGGASITNIVNVTVQGGDNAEKTGDVVSNKVIQTMRGIADQQIANSLRLGGALNQVGA
jgi:TP901 family phage tail tape measure protein/lambda family phage tail tape measure protein